MPAVLPVSLVILFTPLPNQSDNIFPFIGLNTATGFALTTHADSISTDAFCSPAAH